jgi:glycosyltransferase involved in cell wall biosynthesis
VDVANCDRGNADRFRQKYKPNREFVLWMGRNDPVKCPADILSAAKRLPHVSFVLAGDGCLQNELEQLTGENLPANVQLTGPLNRNDAQDALAACSLLAATSLREGLPTLLLEGLAHGRTIVTSDAEGCLDATDGGDLAFVYPRKNVDQLCAQIESALQQTGCNRQQGREFVEKYFDWRVVSKRLDEIYLGKSL